jgi:hypothetical protein
MYPNSDIDVVRCFVVGRALLGGQVERVEADVMPADVEGHCGLARREAPKAGNPQLDDESSARCEVARGVGEAGDLLGLGAQVCDAVPDDVYE